MGFESLVIQHWLLQCQAMPVNYMEKTFFERLACLRYAVKNFEQLKWVKSPRFVLKKFFSTPDFYNNVDKCFSYTNSLPYKNDGIIFTQTNASYMRGKTLKWKPYDRLTIDFFIKKENTSG